MITYPFLAHIMLTFIWMALTGIFSAGNALLGFVLTYILMGAVSSGSPWHGYIRKLPAVVGIGLYFLKELIKANFEVAQATLGPLSYMRPGIVAVPLDVKSDAGITLLANLITLTPGTLSLDISSDCTVLYVHTMHVGRPEDFRREIKEGFEKRIMEVFDA